MSRWTRWRVVSSVAISVVEVRVELPLARRVVEGAEGAERVLLLF